MHFLYWALNTFGTFPKKTEPGFLSNRCYFIIFNQSCSGVISSISGYIVGDEALPPWELRLWGLGSPGNAQRPTRQPAQVTSPGLCIPVAQLRLSSCDQHPGLLSLKSGWAHFYQRGIFWECCSCHMVYFQTERQTEPGGMRCVFWADQFPQ